jgi:hypothetical protein
VPRSWAEQEHLCSLFVDPEQPPVDQASALLLGTLERAMVEARAADDESVGLLHRGVASRAAAVAQKLETRLELLRDLVHSGAAR